MKPIPINVAMRTFQGTYTDLEAEDLPANTLSYAINTRWKNAFKPAKRLGYEKKTWAGTGYHKTTSFSTGLNKPKVLSYAACQKRGGNNIYEVLLLQETQPIPVSAATGFVYIEITNASTGALVSSTLQKYNEGGQTKNQNPTFGKVIQGLDYILMVDGSEDTLFYLDLTSSETGTTWSKVTINNTAIGGKGYIDNTQFIDLDIYNNYLFITGNKGLAMHSQRFDLIDFADSTASFIEYQSTSGKISRELISSFEGLVICSDNKDLNEYGMDLMTGTVPYDDTKPATETRGFDVKALSSDISFIPGSIQNIDNNLIGLTQSGVVDLTTLLKNRNVSRIGDEGGNDIDLEDTLSYPIDDIIREMNKSSSAIYSCHDPLNKRYYLSVPNQTESTATNFVYVYDYKYQSGIPRWSIWRLSMQNITGLFTVKNLPYVADQDGHLYQLDKGTTDDSTQFLARIESPAVGGESIYYSKKWDGAAAVLKTKADNKEKNFNIFVVSDEFQESINNSDEATKKHTLKSTKKFPSIFDRHYTFDRNRTFNDDGFGREIFFTKRDFYDSRTLRLVIEETLDEDNNAVDEWELKSMYVKGHIDSIAK